MAGAEAAIAGTLAALTLFGLASAAASAAPAYYDWSEAAYADGCFPGQQTDGAAYVVDLEVGGREVVRLRYPAACDAGNWARARHRRQTTLNLHGDVRDGRCRTFDQWVAHDPFLHGRFTLFLSAYERARDIDGLLSGLAPGRATGWTIGDPEAGGLRPLRYRRGDGAVPDSFDRWVRTDPEGRAVEILICRKADAVASAECERHGLFDGFRTRLAFKRAFLARLREIEGYGRNMLRCAMGLPANSE